MPSLKLQKRLAASELGCGKRKIWMDPNEVQEIGAASSREAVRKLIRNNFILRMPVKVHSRARARARHEAKLKGRHSGLGKRHGTSEARMPSKILWIRRIRVLRRLLKKYRKQHKIDRHLYQELYAKSKGNVYKNKRNLIEAIHKRKAENVRSKIEGEQLKVRRERNAEMRKRKAQRLAERQIMLTGAFLAAGSASEQKKPKTKAQAKVQTETAPKKDVAKSAAAPKKDASKPKKAAGGGAAAKKPAVKK